MDTAIHAIKSMKYRRVDSHSHVFSVRCASKQDAACLFKAAELEDLISPSAGVDIYISTPKRAGAYYICQIAPPRYVLYAGMEEDFWNLLKHCFREELYMAIRRRMAVESIGV